MSQNNEILSYMAKGSAITPMDALKKFGCFRLASRINELRNDGHKIHRIMKERNGKRFASYYLIERAK
jgi:hypothetical protein